MRPSFVLAVTLDKRDICPTCQSSSLNLTASRWHLFTLLQLAGIHATQEMKRLWLWFSFSNVEKVNLLVLFLAHFSLTLWPVLVKLPRKQEYSLCWALIWKLLCSWPTSQEITVTTKQSHILWAVQSLSYYMWNSFNVYIHIAFCREIIEKFKNKLNRLTREAIKVSKLCLYIDR